MPVRLDTANSWQIAGVRDPEAFFGALPLLVPDATHLYLEGSPAPDVLAIAADHAGEGEYAAPAGTLASWPGRNRRFTLAVSARLFARLAEAARRHAAPEICSHLHLYRGAEPLVQWFDAFDDPLLVNKAVPRDMVDEFCVETGGVVADPGS